MLSHLELTLQAFKQNGTETREVFLVLVSNKSVFVEFEAPEIPLHLAYVSVRALTPGRLWEAPAWSLSVSNTATRKAEAGRDKARS